MGTRNNLRIGFKRFERCEIVPEDGVYLFSERPGKVRLAGTLIEAMAPLLDGSRSRSQIVSAMEPLFPAHRVGETLDRLLDLGHLVEYRAATNRDLAGFWEMADLDGDGAVESVSRGRVALRFLVDVLAADVDDALTGFGLRVVEDAAQLTVVVTDDYLRPELGELNAEFVARGQPWLLTKPVGSTLWVGPIFRPNETACWSCLAHRLTGNRTVMNYLSQSSRKASVVSPTVVRIPSIQKIAANLAALAVANWFAEAGGSPLAAPRRNAHDAPPRRPCEIVTLDALTSTSRRHVVRRRPQCEACGDPRLQADLQSRPVMFLPRRKHSTSDGGHRARSPEQLLADYEPHISPITGVVQHLVRLQNGSDGLYAYHAGENYAVPMEDIRDLRAGLRSGACGKGMSDVQARASAMAEAIERYSGYYRGDEARIQATGDELGRHAVEPNQVHLFSDAQIATRAETNAKASLFSRVCDPFDPSRSIEWTPIWSVLDGERFYLPTATLFYGYPTEPGRVYSVADSNGNAAGSSIEDATVQGFLELVERDCVAMWWYNRLRRPAIDLATFDEPYFAIWQEQYRRLNRESWVLDLTNDLDVPAVVAISRRVDQTTEDILFAFGAHFDVRVAISRAMTEMNQFLSAVRPGEDGSDYLFPGSEHQWWWRHATLSNQPYLSPAASPLRTQANFPGPEQTDLRQDVMRAARIASDAGLRMMVVDQTRPDIGLPVVKVVVPGMRHFWSRFAPGRLYDVPVSLGWCDRRLTEDELNPVSMFV